MRGNPRRADEAPEGPFRAPERLALALPLTAALGLTIVMAAAALGQSLLMVTLAAAGGFALCAAAPMALLQVYVGRPLRVALAHLRAARDGAEAPPAPPAPGVIADLVAVARDIRAGEANHGQYRAGVALCEKMAVAGEEAIRAFRLQCEELVETTAQGESDRRLCAQEQFAEIAEALKAFKATPPTSALDAGMERIERMLVYLADALERHEKPSGGGDRVDAALTDVVRLIGRETQAIRDTLAAAALTVRNDIAGAVSDDKAAHVRQQERLDALEARVVTRLADFAAPAFSRLVDVLRTEAETTRRALRDRLDSIALAPAPADEPPLSLRAALEGTVARLDAAAATMRVEREARAPDLQALAEAVARIGETSAARGEGEALRDEVRAAAAGLRDVAERLREQGQAQTERLDAIEARVSKEAGEAARDRQAAALTVLTKCTDKLRNALDRFDVLSSAAASANAGQADDLRAAVEAQSRTFDALRADVAGVAPRVEELCEGLARRLDMLDAKALQPATRDLAAAQARCESFARQISISAAALAALAEREGRDFDRLHVAFDGAKNAFAGAAAATQAQASQGGEGFRVWGGGALATLHETTQGLAQTSAAPARAGEGVETVATQAQDAQARLGDTLAPLDALASAVTALHVLTRPHEAFAGRILSGVEGLQAVASADRAERRALRERADDPATLKDGARATLEALTQEIARLRTAP